MKLGTQVYSRPKRGQKCIQVSFNPDTRFSHALNFTGFAYVDCKYGLVKNILNESVCNVVVSDNDLIGRDDYIAVLSKNTTVVLVYQKMTEAHSMLDRISNVAFGGCGASKKRLQNTKARLKNAGIKVKLFTSEQTCLNYLKGIRS